MSEKHTNCPSCGCGFIQKYEDGTRICLYCPERWNNNVEQLNEETK